MEDSRDLPEINLELFGDAAWIFLIFFLALWNDPAMDKDLLEKALEKTQKDLEKENRPNRPD